MSVNTANTLVAFTNNVFIEPSNKFLAGFYQQLIGSVSNIGEIGKKLIRYAEAALAFRRVETVEGIATILSNLPVKEYQLAGQYYLARCAYRRGECPQAQLEQVYSESRLFKARALSSLAAIEARRGDFSAEAAYFYESIKAAHDTPTVIESLRAIAVVKAKEGSHTWAVKELESYLPLLRYASPYVYYAFLNSYAVELGEAGRVYEARNVCNLVLASPFASAYPEWLETAEELRPASRSFAPVKPSKIGRAKLLRMPQIEQVESTEVRTPAPVISLTDWKKRMGKDNGTDDSENADGKNLAFKLMGTVARANLTDDELLKLLNTINQIIAERNKEEEEQ